MISAPFWEKKITFLFLKNRDRNLFKKQQKKNPTTSCIRHDKRTEKTNSTFLLVAATMLEEFKESLQLALSWMEDVQRQLKTNDCTEGPLDVLEARLQETKVGERESPYWIKQNEEHNSVGGVVQDLNLCTRCNCFFCHCQCIHTSLMSILQ